MLSEAVTLCKFHEIQKKKKGTDGTLSGTATLELH